jgi:hypothetical protein
MAMDELTCTFVGLMDYLQAQYDTPPGMVRFIAMDPRRTLERLILQEWRQGIPPYVGLNIPSYLLTLSLPCGTLQILYENMPRTLEYVPKEKRWVQLCLSLSPPFQIKNPNHIRDMRPAYKNRVGAPCRDRAKLIECMATALYDYELRTEVCRDVSHDAVAEMQNGIKGNTTAELLFRTLRHQGRLPAPLKGIRTTEFKGAVTMLDTVLRGLVSAYDDFSPAWQKTYISKGYDQLLLAMCNAFEQEGPGNHYPAAAIYFALSAILSSLLVVHEMLLDPHCTTPGAIQRRLSRLRSA